MRRKMATVNNPNLYYLQNMTLRMRTMRSAQEIELADHYMDIR